VSQKGGEALLRLPPTLKPFLRNLLRFKEGISMYKIAVDLGYGFTKAINQENDELVFPSLVGSGHRRPLANATPYTHTTLNKSVLDELDVEICEVRGHGDLISIGGKDEFFIGELARRESRDVSYAFADNKITHPNTRALLLTACALLMKNDNQPIHLITGLPVQHYAPQKGELERYLRGLRYKVKFKSGPWKGIEKTVYIEKVSIFPQAGGALYSEFLNLDGSVKAPDLLESATLISIIDVGFKTTDYVVLDAQHGLDYMNDYSGTIKAGMNHAYLAIKRVIEDTTQETIDMADLDQAIFQKSITCRGVVYDLKDTIQKAYAALAKSIIDRLEINWPKKNFYSHIFLAGGGGLALADYFKNFHHNIRLVSNAQTANARGYLALANAIDAENATEQTM